MKADSGKFWLNGKYYHMDMTYEEFMANDNWKAGSEYGNSDETYDQVVELEDGKCEVWITVTADGEIEGYRFESEECMVVLPDGVNNFGMVPDRITHIYGEENKMSYTLNYDAGSSIHVELEQNRRGMTYCDIYVDILRHE